MMAFFYGLLAVAVLVVALAAWNFFARRYNDRRLATSACLACGAMLGYECIAPARAKWRQGVQNMRMQGKSGIRLSNLELCCAHCGARNYERDLYATRR